MARRLASMEVPKGYPIEDDKKIKVRVFRYDPIKDTTPIYRTYEIPYTPNMTVLGALQYIQENIDSSIAFRFGCRSGMCGECALMVNGKPVLACKTLITTRELVLEPLLSFPVIRDLVVDRAQIENRTNNFKKAPAFHPTRTYEFRNYK